MVDQKSLDKSFRSFHQSTNSLSAIPRKGGERTEQGGGKKNEIKEKIRWTVRQIFDPFLSIYIRGGEERGWMGGMEWIGLDWIGG